MHDHEDYLRTKKFFYTKSDASGVYSLIERIPFNGSKDDLDNFYTLFKDKCYELREKPEVLGSHGPI